MVALTIAVTIAIAVTISAAIAVTIALAIAVAVAVAVAITHRHCCCRWPLRLRLPSAIAATISVVMLSAIAVSVALSVGHCCLRHRRPLQLPLSSAITGAMPLAISESCYLGATRIVFNQLKQRMLTLFYFVRTLGGILIEAGSLTRCQAAMANTSTGRQTASSERLVREVAGSRGAAGRQKGGDID
jgi:hypothetical protein